MLVPRGVLERDGLLDEDLFAYSEDTDWSLCARAAGYRDYVVPARSVWHKASLSSGGESSPATIYHGLRNALVVSECWAPLGRAWTWRRRFVLLAAHVAQAFLSPRRTAGLRAVRDGWHDFRRGRHTRRRVVAVRLLTDAEAHAP